MTAPAQTYKPGTKVPVYLPLVGKVQATADDDGKLYVCVPMPSGVFRAKPASAKDDKKSVENKG